MEIVALVSPDPYFSIKNKEIYMSKIIYLKVGLSLLIGFALIYPFFSTSTTGILRELDTLGLTWSLILMSLFFIAVAFYAKALENTLKLVNKKARKAEPKSVWLMFLIPYNFIEDFFIIHSVTESLKAQALFDNRLNKIKGFGSLSGFGWCTAQIISLIPNELGAVAGVIAFILWLVHWYFIVQTNKLLSAH